MKNILTFEEFVNESKALDHRPEGIEDSVVSGIADWIGKKNSELGKLIYQDRKAQAALSAFVKAVKPVLDSIDESIKEGFMSDLDIIRQESKTARDFIKKAISSYPSLKGGESWLEELWTSSKSIDEFEGSLGGSTTLASDLFLATQTTANGIAF